MEILGSLDPRGELRAELAAGGTLIEFRERDANLVIRTPDGQTVMCETEMRTSLDSAAAYRLAARAQVSDGRLLVFAHRATKTARDVLRAAHVGLVTESYAHVSLPSALIHIDRPSASVQRRENRPGRLTGKAALVAEALLVGGQRAWQVQEVAERAKISTSLAHRVLARLEKEQIVVSQGTGPHRVRSLAQPSALLDLWAEEAGNPVRRRTDVYMFVASAAELVPTVLRKLNTADLRFAVTGAAAAMSLVPHLTTIPSVDVWIPAAASPRDIAERLGGAVVDRGHNVTLLQSRDDSPLAFASTEAAAPRVSTFRLYIDLLRDQKRGEEQAARLREEVLGI